MQNVDTLLELGFKHYPEWDCTATEDKNYRLVYKGLVFMAHCWDETHGYRREHRFVTIGLVTDCGRYVKGWLDCSSTGSVKRKIERIWKERQ